MRLHKHLFSKTGSVLVGKAVEKHGLAAALAAARILFF